MDENDRTHHRDALWTAKSFVDSPELRADFERCSEGVYFIDLQGRIIFWNRGAEQITGFLPQDVLGRCCSEHDLLVHCDDTGRILCQTGCPLRATAQDRQSREVRVHLRHRHGYRVPVRVRSAPLYNAAGDLCGVSEIFSVPAARRPECPSRHVFPVALLQVEEVDAIRKRYGFDGAARIFYCIERTLRRELDSCTALCRLNPWTFVAIFGEHDSNDPRQTLKRVRQVVEHADTLWWGDVVEVGLTATYTWLFPGESLGHVIEKMEARLSEAREALAPVLQSSG